MSPAAAVGACKIDTGVAEADAVTATATAGGAKPKGIDLETKAFWSSVMAWPVNGTGYVNLHYSMTTPRHPDEKDIVTGKPFQNIDQFISFAQWCISTSNIKELWYCTSLQAQVGKTAHGKPKAVRLHQNNLFNKAIWIDCDVGNTPDKPGKHYDTIEEAWAAISAFIKAAGLPMPSAVVKSGGGRHIYWISNVALPPETWAPYAHGLRALLVQHGIKCDAGLTTDDVRLLRVPSTLNHKYTPPRPVELLPFPLVEYDFSTALALLPTIAPVVNHISTAPMGLPAAFAGLKAPWTGEGKLGDGIETRPEMPQLDPRPVFKECGFMREAPMTGGKDYANPLWNLSVLATIFMENGNKIAHQISKGHPSYTV